MNRAARRAHMQRQAAPDAPTLDLDTSALLLDACRGVMPGPMVGDERIADVTAIVATREAIRRAEVETGSRPPRLFVSLARADQLRRELKAVCVREAHEAAVEHAAICVIDGVPVYLSPVGDGDDARELLRRAYPDRDPKSYPRSALLDLLPKVSR